jgi:hypothetical protein
MAYYITDAQPQCEGWAIVDEEFDLKGCYRLEADAKKVAIEMAMLRNEPYGGVWKDGQLPLNHDGLDMNDLSL